MKKNKVPTGKWQRAGIAGMAGLRAGTSHLRHTVQGLLPGQEEDRAAQRQARDEDVARIIFEGLNQLRGTALKAAQLLCMEIEILPEALRKQLGKSFYQVPPMHAAMSRTLILSELDALPEHLFQHFETDAFAAASLGQVHRATSRVGEPLAVKIQYPGIADSLTNDIRMLRGLLKMMPLGHIVRPQVISRTLREIEDRLHEEIDYQLEAEHYQWFADQFRNWPQLVIPRVYPTWITPVILTTSRLDGLHPDQWLEQKRPTQQERDHFGQLIADFFYHSLFDLQRVHADPSPGNFIMLPEGRLGVIDFGCVQSFDPTFIGHMWKSLQGYVDDDLNAVVEAYQGMGLLKEDGNDTNKALAERFRPMRDYMARLIGSDTFDFSAHPGYVSASRHLFAETLGMVETIPRGLSYYNRAFGGMLRILDQLGANVCLHPQRDYTQQTDTTA